MVMCTYCLEACACKAVVWLRVRMDACKAVVWLCVRTVWRLVRQSYCCVYVLYGGL